MASKNNIVKGKKQINIFRTRKQIMEQEVDWVAVEEPLEIRLVFGPKKQRIQKSIAVTMRTPGQDFDLVRGFLFTEGIINHREPILQMRYSGNQLQEQAQENILTITIQEDYPIDISQLSRHFYTASSCGVCGKTSIEMVQTNTVFLLPKGKPLMYKALLEAAPKKLLEAQKTFEKTGGLHAAGLFSTDGELILLREDVGRHNALDKLIGAALKQKMLPLKHYFLLLSGRLSFELVQKALMAGIPIVAAVGAPSSLAVELAETNGMSLIGFLKKDYFNVYCGEERIKMGSAQ